MQCYECSALISVFVTSAIVRVKQIGLIYTVIAEAWSLTIMPKCLKWYQKQTLIFNDFFTIFDKWLKLHSSITSRDIPVQKLTNDLALLKNKCSWASQTFDFQTRSPSTRTQILSWKVPFAVLKTTLLRLCAVYLPTLICIVYTFVHHLHIFSNVQIWWAELGLATHEQWKS